MMQLRNHARIGHQPRIRGEDAGHVLPQHDMTRAKRSRQQGGGQVRAAAAERREAAVGRAADEAGTTATGRRR